MKRILFIAPMADGQTGYYITNAFKKLGWQIATYDHREVMKKVGIDKLVDHIKANVDILEPKPDLMLILKGLEVKPEAVEYAKSKGIKTACWIFDATLAGTPIPESPKYIDMMKHYDIFYSYCDNIDDLKKAGLKNAKLLPEGYSEEFNGGQVLNHYLEKTFGSDIVFIGTIDDIHPCREEFLEKIIDEGFDLKIYGNIIKDVKPKIMDKHQKMCLVNEFHSYACQASKIVIGGLDADYQVNRSHSARVYRVLACGGFYLCKKTAGIEHDFTPGVHLDTFETEEEMIEKIVYYLNHPEEREKIAKAGQEKVKEYTFLKRIEKEFGRGDDGKN